MIDFSVPESLQVGSVIGNVIATDVDNLNPVLYIPDVTTGFPFFVRPFSGNVTLESALDYETL